VDYYGRECPCPLTTSHQVCLLPPHTSRPVLDGVCKRFLGVAALNNVFHEVAAGEVHALLGSTGIVTARFPRACALDALQAAQDTASNVKLHLETA
jgi:hypothetical protein